MIESLNRLLENIPSGVSVLHRPQDYDRAIRVHPFYNEMAAKIIDFGNRYHPGRKKILEIGPFTGTLTERTIFCLNPKKYVVAEPEEEAFRFLKEKLGYIENLELVNEDLENLSGEKFDLVISSFVDHHIPYEQKEDYYRKINSLLHPGEVYVSGEEFIRDFENEKQKVNALKEYHGWIIQKCIEGNHFLMAEIEAHALKNGIENFDEYKTSLEKYLEYLKAADFEICEKEKIGPDDSVLKNSGIYVVVGKSG